MAVSRFTPAWPGLPRGPSPPAVDASAASTTCQAARRSGWPLTASRISFARSRSGTGPGSPGTARRAPGRPSLAVEQLAQHRSSRPAGDLSRLQGGVIERAFSWSAAIAATSSLHRFCTSGSASSSSTSFSRPVAAFRTPARARAASPASSGPCRRAKYFSSTVVGGTPVTSSMTRCRNSTSVGGWTVIRPTVAGVRSGTRRCGSAQLFHPVALCLPPVPAAAFICFSAADGRRAAASRFLPAGVGPRGVRSPATLASASLTLASP